jgi:hypothetical protein
VLGQRSIFQVTNISYESPLVTGMVPEVLSTIAMASDTTTFRITVRYVARTWPPTPSSTPASPPSCVPKCARASVERGALLHLVSPRLTAAPSCTRACSRLCSLRQGSGFSGPSQPSWVGLRPVNHPSALSWCLPGAVPAVPLASALAAAAVVPAGNVGAQSDAAMTFTLPQWVPRIVPAATIQLIVAGQAAPPLTLQFGPPVIVSLSLDAQRKPNETHKSVVVYGSNFGPGLISVCTDDGGVVVTVNDQPCLALEFLVVRLPAHARSVRLCMYGVHVSLFCSCLFRAL